MVTMYVPFLTFSGCSDLCDSVGRTIWIAAERAGAAMAQRMRMGTREGGREEERKQVRHRKRGKKDRRRPDHAR